MPDQKSIEDFLNLLARAVRQLRMYPATSPICHEAVAACHKLLVALDAREQLAFRVTPRALLVDEVAVSGVAGVEQELARRLHRAGVWALSIDRAVTVRELLRFCTDLVRAGDHGEPTPALSELLAEHGVEKIAVREAMRPEVLPIGAPGAALCDLVQRERARREPMLAGAGPVSHLYQPGKGWIRLDPSVSFDAISLADLAILVQDPAELAAMLMRLTDDNVATEDWRDRALEQKFGDVATVLSSLDPQLAHIMFARLARAVLDLGAERRQALLRRTILPGLLDGRVDGDVLKEFPDLDLADSLFLLLDLETAAPEVLTTALDRLNLPSERQAAVVPLLEARLDERESGRAGDRASGADSARGTRDPGESYVRRLIRIGHDEGKSFAEFDAFDLSMGDETRASLMELREAIAATDMVEERLACLWRLVRLEPNPALAERFLHQSLAALEVLESEARWPDLVTWIDRFRQVADTVREPRPDVADAIAGRLAAFFTTERAVQLARLAERGADGRALAGQFIEAFGAAVAPGLVAALRDPAAARESRSLVSLLCDHARLLAPRFVEHLKAPTKEDILILPSLVRVVGFAGAGYEAVIGEHLKRTDEQTVREAFRALTRIATPEAAALVAAHVEQDKGWRQAAAEEAFWRFPVAEVSRQCRRLLGRRDFVIRHPEVAGRLLDRAGQARVDGLEQAIAAIAPLRFRFWNPPLMRVAFKARALLTPTAGG